MPRSAHRQPKPKKPISNIVTDYDCITAFTKGKVATSISYISTKKPTGTIVLYSKSGESVGSEIVKLETINRNQVLFVNTHHPEHDTVEKIVLLMNSIPVMDFDFHVIQREKIREVLNGK